VEFTETPTFTALIAENLEDGSLASLSWFGRECRTM
jgi:hypothetical protein